MTIHPVNRRIQNIIPVAALMLLSSALTGARTVATGTSSPEPSPSPENPSAPTDAPASVNLGLSTFMLIASFVVIATALYFAIKYHKALLDFMHKALARGTAYTGTLGSAYSENAIPLSDGDTNAQGNAPDALIIGPPTGVSGQELIFVLDTKFFDDSSTPQRLLDVHWSIDNTPVEGTTTHFLKHTFEQSGVFVVEATVDNKSIPPFIVAITAPIAASGLSLPFAIQNWGRMVVLLFGLGVVGALIASRALSSEAGAGLLGALLGIGAATAGSGNGTNVDGGTGAKGGSSTGQNP